MDIKERLKEIGLSHNEIKVYLFLVDYGRSKAGKIAKGTGIQRSSAYGAINSLTHKALIGYVTVGDVKEFQATSPNRLVEYLKEKQEMMQEIIPDLTERHKIGKKEGQVRLFDGYAGVKAVFKDMIRTGENNLCFGDDGALRKRMSVFCDQYIRDKSIAGLKTRILTRIRHVSNSKGSTYRYVDEATESNVAVNIYGEKINIIVWTDKPEAIIIENAEAAKAFKAYFEFMWKHAKAS